MAWPMQRHSQHVTEQMILGHSDTVWPLGTIQTKLPLDISDELIRGPGVYDMKTGLTQMVFALKCVHDLELEPSCAPVVFVNSDEELDSAESKSNIQHLARRMNRVFVLEPSAGPQGSLKTTRKGVGQYRISIEGVAAHAGLEPEKGASAIVEMSHVIRRLDELNEPNKGINVNIGVINGGFQANVIAPSCTAQVDVRVPTLRDAQQLEEVLFSLSPQNPDIAAIHVDGQLETPPMEVTPGNQLLWEAAREIGGELGLTLQESSSGGGSDGCITSQFAPTLDGLGAVGGGAHSYGEHVRKDKLLERTELLVHLLLAPPSEVHRDHLRSVQPQ